jgi:membrane fusion protein, copper/silver efflux system
MRHALALLGAALIAGCSREQPPLTPAADEHAQHAAARGEHARDVPPTTMLPAGHAQVHVPEDRQQLIGVRTTMVEQGPMSGIIRANGIVQVEEGREVLVHSKVSGFLERVHVEATGDRVVQGDPLYDLFSQDLQVAQDEYLRARRTDPRLAAAARERMLRWDVSPEHMRQLVRTGATRTVTFLAPRTGVVLERAATEGEFITPDTTLFRIADLREVWVVAQVYEYEAARIDPAQPAQLRVQGQTRMRRATVEYVHPTVDPQSRTISVRLTVPNPDGALRPGSFAVVELATRPVEALWVPDEAVIETGTRQLVYLALPDGWFRPVQVAVGRQLDGRVEIRRGLAAGDRVVVGAQFLIDSESRLRAVPGGPGHGGH